MVADVPLRGTELGTFLSGLVIAVVLCPYAQSKIAEPFLHVDHATPQIHPRWGSALSVYLARRYKAIAIVDEPSQAEQVEADE